MPHQTKMIGENESYAPFWLDSISNTLKNKKVSHEHLFVVCLHIRRYTYRNHASTVYEASHHQYQLHWFMNLISRKYLISGEKDSSHIQTPLHSSKAFLLNLCRFNQFLRKCVCVFFFYIPNTNNIIIIGIANRNVFTEIASE